MKARRPKESIAELEQKLGHRFKSAEFLRRALSHSSYAHEIIMGGDDNEPLEFLGDSLLGFLISEKLFEVFPDRDEGDLSRFKASLVNADTLALKARRLDLGTHLLLGKTAERVGARTKGSLLSDAFEAVLAAVYLDGGVEAARSVVERMFAADIKGLTRTGLSQERDAKTALQELLQARARETPRYQILKESGPAHRRNFLIGLVIEGKLVARGRGRTRKAAEQAAARKVLQAVRETQAEG